MLDQIGHRIAQAMKQVRERLTPTQVLIVTMYLTIWCISLNLYRVLQNMFIFL